MRPQFSLAILTLVAITNGGLTAVFADVTAAVGHPYGVARVTLPNSVGTPSFVVSTNGYTIDDPDNRVFYPAVAHGRVVALIQELLGSANGNSDTVTVFFLFRGDQPFEITIHTPGRQTVSVVPQRNPRLFRRLQRNWWRQYTTLTRLKIQEGDYSPFIETYLTAMLGKRLGLPDPLLDRITKNSASIQRQALQIVFNVESMRLQAMKDTLNGYIDSGTAHNPLPSPIKWIERQRPEIPQGVEIESIAKQVPEECFYIRFGSFDHYLWMQDLLEQNGGDLARMITLRGHDAMLSQRVQDQLGLKRTKLSKILGNQVIADVALIGHDTYLREGAAIGVLFEANTNLLTSELMSQRKAAVEDLSDQGAEMTTVPIGDQNVSLASSPDNRLRSFYVNVGDFHFVTTSRHLMERFLAVASGKSRSLGDTLDFRRARQQYTQDEQTAVFGFLPPEFFRQLVSPAYQIELRRRLRAVTDLELVQLARLVAIQEGHPHETVDDLVDAGLLPHRFSTRPDQSYVVLHGELAMDSARGRRGTFVPILDMPIDQITDEEHRRYREIADFHERSWQDMDPLFFRLKKYKSENKDHERILVETEILPFDREKYGLITSIVGPATNTQVRQSSGDAVQIQLSLQGGQLRPNIGAHHLFFGIQDREIPVQFSEELIIRWLQTLRTAPAYLGAWPKLGLIDLLPIQRGTAVDRPGLSRVPFGLWRLVTPAGFALLGTNANVLETAAAELELEKTNSDAQIRIHITDVSQAKIKSWFAAMDFQRAYQTSRGNTRLLNTVVEQLGVLPADALKTAEKILGMRLICALGGEYELYEIQGREYWASSHWPTIRNDDANPAQFASPLMAWFRGMDAEISLYSERVSAKATLEISKNESGTLPFFNFFRSQ